MPTPPSPDSTLQETVTVLLACGSINKTAETMGLHRSTVQERLKQAKKRGILVDGETFPPSKHVTAAPTAFELGHIPETIDIDELIERRKRQYDKKAAFEEATKLIPVKIKIEGPIGILVFGDPHVDDDDTDLEALERHARLVAETPGLFAGNIGDTTNNWTGRLARLYAEQSTSAEEASALAEWFVTLTRDWLFILGGNHDLWTGSGDIMKWITRQAGHAYFPSQTRLALQFPNGREVRINARHDFEGHSQYNPAHGVMKAFLMGFRDHIMLAGHKHISAYGVQKDADSGVINHAVRVASYKVYDRYAKERGLRDQHISPCAVVVIDPDASEAGLVHVFWDPEEGAKYLTYLRSQK